MDKILAWFGEHEASTITVIVVVGVLVAIALLERADVTSFVRMVAGWFGA